MTDSCGLGGGSSHLDFFREQCVGCVPLVRHGHPPDYSDCKVGVAITLDVLRSVRHFFGGGYVDPPHHVPEPAVHERRKVAVTTRGATRPPSARADPTISVHSRDRSEAESAGKGPIGSTPDVTPHLVERRDR